jgi:hypothetical protein
LAGCAGIIYVVGSSAWISAEAQQSLVTAISGPIGNVDYAP